MSRRPRAVRRALAVGAVALVLGLAGCSDDDTTVETPDAESRQQTSVELARAAQAQRVCYGWALRRSGGSDWSSRGSNLGDTIPVESDPRRCPKWVEVRATVYYAPESSEASDSATIEVETSPDLTVGYAIKYGLARFGLDEQAFIDDPALAISRAALALPLLTAESGAAEPAPTPSAAPAATPVPLAGAGNDFWRDRWGFMLAGAILLLLAGLFMAIGVHQRNHPPAAKPNRPVNPVEHVGGSALRGRTGGGSGKGRNVKRANRP